MRPPENAERFTMREATARSSTRWDRRSERPPWRERVITFLAPALLLSVAVIHFYLVHAERLSPWKGGGFGMFSTLESPASRVVRLQLISGSERIPVIVPAELSGLVSEIRTLPQRKRLQELAQRAAAGAWVPYRVVPAAQHYEMLRERYSASTAMAGTRSTDISVDVYSLENAAHASMLFDRLRFVRMVPPGEVPRHVIRIDRVQAEVWQLRYDGRTRRLGLSLIDRVEAVHGN